MADRLEGKLGVQFANRRLLDEALTHSSYFHEFPDHDIPCNERLEFLGDSVLGFVIADELFRRFPLMKEGQLTELRAHLVRRETLATLANRLCLGSFLLMGRGEDLSGGRKRDSNLSSALEAVIGAVYLDKGHHISRELVLRLWSDHVQNIDDKGIPKDPKSELQELIQAQGSDAPIYNLVTEDGPPHDRYFTIEVYVNGESLGIGVGKRKLDAERGAARDALSNLRH